MVIGSIPRTQEQLGQLWSSARDETIAGIRQTDLQMTANSFFQFQPSILYSILSSIQCAFNYPSLQSYHWSTQPRKQLPSYRHSNVHFTTDQSLFHPTTNLISNPTIDATQDFMCLAFHPTYPPFIHNNLCRTHFTGQASSGFSPVGDGLSHNREQTAREKTDQNSPDTIDRFKKIAWPNRFRLMMSNLPGKNEVLDPTFASIMD